MSGEGQGPPCPRRPEHGPMRPWTPDDGARGVAGWAPTADEPVAWVCDVTGCEGRDVLRQGEQGS